MFSSFHFPLELGCSGLKLVFADQSQNKIFCLVIDLVLNSNYFYVILITSSALTNIPTLKATLFPFMLHNVMDSCSLVLLVHHPQVTI